MKTVLNTYEQHKQHIEVLLANHCSTGAFLTENVIVFDKESESSRPAIIVTLGTVEIYVIMKLRAYEKQHNVNICYLFDLCDSFET